MAHSAARYLQTYDQVKELLEVDLKFIKDLAQDTPDQHLSTIILTPDQKKFLITLVEHYEKFIQKLSDLDHLRVDYGDNFSEFDKINLVTAAHIALKAPSQNNIAHFQKLLTCKLINTNPAENPLYIPLNTRGKSNKWYSLGWAIAGLLCVSFSILTAIFTHGISLKAESTALKMATCGLGISTCFFAGASLFFFRQAYKQYKGALLPTVETEGETVVEELRHEAAPAALSAIFPRAGGR